MHIQTHGNGPANAKCTRYVTCSTFAWSLLCVCVSVHVWARPTIVVPLKADILLFWSETTFWNCMCCAASLLRHLLHGPSVPTVPYLSQPTEFRLWIKKLRKCLASPASIIFSRFFHCCPHNCVCACDYIDRRVKRKWPQICSTIWRELQMKLIRNSFVCAVGTISKISVDFQ